MKNDIISVATAPGAIEHILAVSAAAWLLVGALAMASSPQTSVETGSLKCLVCVDQALPSKTKTKVASTPRHVGSQAMAPEVKQTAQVLQR